MRLERAAIPAARFAAPISKAIRQWRNITR
jgi:hypothetical protein